MPLLDSIKSTVIYRDFDVSVKFKNEAPANDQAQEPEKGLNFVQTIMKGFTDHADYFSRESDYWGKKANGEKVKRAIDNEISCDPHYKFNMIERIGNALLSPLGYCYDEWECAEAQGSSNWKKACIVLIGCAAALPAVVGLALKALGEAFNSLSTLRNDAIRRYIPIVEGTDRLPALITKSSGFSISSLSKFGEVHPGDDFAKVQKSLTIASLILQLTSRVLNGDDESGIAKQLKELFPENQDWKAEIEKTIERCKEHSEDIRKIMKIRQNILRNQTTYNDILAEMQQANA